MRERRRPWETTDPRPGDFGGELAPGLQAAQGKPGGLEKVLVSNGMVTKEDLTAALRLVTVDTIYGLLNGRGSFRFETKPVSYDHEFVEPMNSEFLLLDVLRMVDEAHDRRAPSQL
jgi:hypothetical protein